jgi:hypothetical protein
METTRMMNRHKAGLIIVHPEEQKWNNVWKVFRFPNLTLPTLAALMPQDEWDIAPSRASRLFGSMPS